MISYFWHNETQFLAYSFWVQKLEMTLNFWNDAVDFLQVLHTLYILQQKRVMNWVNGVLRQGKGGQFVEHVPIS